MGSDWQDIRDQTTWSPDAFAPRVYEEHMSGKPRMSGARAGRWLSVWLVMASWCWMFRPSRRRGCGVYSQGHGRKDPDDAVSIGLAALNSTGVAVVHRRAPRHHPGGHARRRRRVRRPRLGRRPDRRHRNPRREQPAHATTSSTKQTTQLTLHRRAPPPDLLLPAAATTSPPAAGGWRSHPKGHGLDPGEDDDTIPQREQPHAKHLTERCRSGAALAA